MSCNRDQGANVSCQTNTATERFQKRPAGIQHGNNIPSVVEIHDCGGVGRLLRYPSAAGIVPVLLCHNSSVRDYLPHPISPIPLWGRPSRWLILKSGHSRPAKEERRFHSASSTRL